jgi:hypothetical protein
MIIKFALLALVALIAAPAALAHGTYLDTAYNTEHNIERKFRVWLLRRAGRCLYGHGLGTTRTLKSWALSAKWDHFGCGNRPTQRGSCVLVAHMTGPSWWQFVVTSWVRNGCTPRQLRG